MILEVCLLFVAVLAFFFIFKKDGNNYPPGPFEIPFFGSGVVAQDHQAENMQKKYGDVFMTKLGSYRFVYLANYKLIKETFSRPEYAGRIWSDLSRVSEREKKMEEASGVIFSRGSIWQHNRRFMLRHLRDLGMGKSRMGDVILREAETLVEGLKEICDKPTEIPFILNMCILNVIWEMVGGHHYSLEEGPEVQKFMDYFNKAQEHFVISGAVDFFPILKKIFPESILHNLFKINSFKDSIIHFNEHIKTYVDEHRENLDPENPNDFIDDYLIDMKKEEGNPESMFTEDDLYRNIFDLFIAGTDTTARSLSWLILYMAEYQEEQRKCQEILDEVVDKGGLPGLEHRDRLTYIDATVNEVTRMASFANFNVFHCTTEDSLLNGYFIPKQTMVAACAGVCHKDPRYWEDPLTFIPSRFISEEGKCIMQKEGFLPFGVGRRQCVGESLARMEMFLMAAAILKSFNIKPCDGEKIDLKPRNLQAFNIPNTKQNLIFTFRNA